jgi:xylulokinase
VQATVVWTGEPPAEVAKRWQTAAGTLLDPVPRDDACLARIRAIRDREGTAP